MFHMKRMLRKDQTVEFVSEVPTILRWNQQDRRQLDQDTKKIPIESEACDVREANLYSRELNSENRHINLDKTKNNDDEIISSKKEDLQKIYLADTSHTLHTSHDVCTAADKSIVKDVPEHQEGKEKPVVTCDSCYK
jgi:hypothetical protein